ncbi:hypothetical protein [Antarcticirhabdus aurantiaca]|uniref:Uncharacterized protein n=1 Tax=Antarcticirhabdus aurantiaca TaxID=2606717 RepID=A0ACD4NRW2_9HYPH|nr:hypothetical protein [Antarcticirhabdus aurantiaca]WAJ29625.1 hypothetical protein OXU80_05165 [Jeongeuplla avenae]
MIDSRTCRAARGFLNWSTRRLAIQADVPVARILDLEGDRPIEAPWLRRLAETFASHGVAPIVENGRLVGVREFENRAEAVRQARRETAETTLIAAGPAPGEG